jgi:hypothetical protein
MPENEIIWEGGVLGVLSVIEDEEGAFVFIAHKQSCHAFIVRTDPKYPGDLILEAPGASLVVGISSEGRPVIRITRNP